MQKFVMAIGPGASSYILEREDKTSCTITVVAPISKETLDDIVYWLSCGHNVVYVTKEFDYWIQKQVLDAIKNFNCLKTCAVYPEITHHSRDYPTVADGWHEIEWQIQDKEDFMDRAVELLGKKGTISALTLAAIEQMGVVAKGDFLQKILARYFTDAAGRKVAIGTIGDREIHITNFFARIPRIDFIRYILIWEKEDCEFDHLVLRWGEDSYAIPIYEIF